MIKRKIMAEEDQVKIAVGSVTLDGDLYIPEQAVGLVAFAHGSGSSRRSPRNRFVAQVLRDAGLATLLFDLLTPKEEEVDVITAELRFDIDLLARRLVGATDWLEHNKATAGLSTGYFGASTGAAAALIAAVERSDKVKAVVSRGGRPDLAMSVLDKVRAPTLLIVGGNDVPVIEMNRKALVKLNVEKRLAIVAGATHLFEESGTLERVADLARDWFTQYLSVKE